ncbi:MAG: hypothetical protein ACRDFZ_00285 [Candidatus Limnocylindria bacterium]
MTRRPTDAERVDLAVNAVLDDRPVALPPALADELAAAHVLRTDLHLVPPGVDFEAALGQRLMDDPALKAGGRVTGFVRHHQRLVLTGAVGSVVVSTAGVAVIARRLARR